MVDRPTDIEGYRDWLRRELDIEIGPERRTHYDTVSRQMRADFMESEFWEEIKTGLARVDAEYRIANGVELLPRDSLAPSVFIKPFDSLVEKTFRKNVVDNDRFPDQPEDDWVVPENWFAKIGDILRTSILVRYLDGVAKVTSELAACCEADHVACEVDFAAHDVGYYAAHFNLWHTFEIPKMRWDTEKVDLSIEFQVATVVHGVVRELLHPYYERQRVSSDEREMWQWDYSSNEFSTNYIGHMSHYLDGMIVGARERQREELG
ncbi:MAG: hypothetical protein GXP35_00485 [Actinobacteria bacterium]|nr:hypothetical protein [Actinomycetota bacterium]